MVNTFMYQQ